jgi:uncharacterized protein (UPF0548 family)
MTPRLDDLSVAPLTYPEVGATAGTLPDGYDHIRRGAIIGRGRERFDSAADALFAWRMHKRAGLRVTASTPTAVVGSVLIAQLGVGPARFEIPTRVVYVINEENRRGFAYGTLSRHPAQGEEAFVVDLREDGQVTFTVTAFSRPARWFSRGAAPAVRLVQRWMTNRYLRALS